MINQLLHKQPVAADRAEHRFMRLRVPVSDWSIASRMNSMFVAATEFGDTAREFPIVFVRAGEDEDGKPAIAPIAVLGMVANENLFVEGTAWRAAYLPAMLRLYPFCIGRLDDERFAICFDASWSGLSGTEGERLFTSEGEPTPFLEDVRKQLEALESEIQRTRFMCRRLRDLELLREMRFDATLPDGGKLTVDGFLTVDEKKLNELGDTTVLELHKSGILGMVHAHYVSLGGMRRLLDWHVKRRTVTGKP
jgi:SapC